MKFLEIYIIIFIILTVNLFQGSNGLKNNFDIIKNNDEINIFSEDDLTKYVNPFIGTQVYREEWCGGLGNTYPGAVSPFGMVQLSPDTGKHVAGYLYEDEYIQGFSHTHVSGFGVNRYGNILLMPSVGEIGITEEEYKSKFSHNQETASPGYYSVNLLDYKIKVELTSTKRCGFHKYSFPSSDYAHIIVDVTHTLQEGERSNYGIADDGFVKVIDQSTIVGFSTQRTPKSNTSYTTYFAARFNKPFDSYGVWSDNKIYHGSDLQSGVDIGAYINFTTLKDEIIKAKVAISYVSEEQAILNLDNEIPDWDFDRVKNDAKYAWNNILSNIKVEGGTIDQRIIFYTALYHSLLMPHIFSDVNGKYIGFDDEIYTANNYTKYATFGLWDTFRSEHPLLTLAYPEIQNEMIQSLIDIYNHYGWFPTWPLANHNQNIMTGDHATPVIVDTYLKGVNDFNITKAYEGMKKNAMKTPPEYCNFNGRSGLKYYKKYGFIPCHKEKDSVSKTLEYAYDDWCLAKIAKELGKNDDYNIFMERSKNYRNLFDPFTRFMRPKYSKYLWKIFFIPGLTCCYNRDYTEGNAWLYTWFVPHDVDGLIDMMGKQLFVRRLDHFFEKFAHPSRPWPCSYFTNYWHGNEPDGHVPYYYNWVDQPWKTQELVRKIMSKLYSNEPNGISGNDDGGALSSWYVFSAMGLYPVCPGDTTYQIGSPIFDKVTIQLDDNYYNGEEFVIIANNVSEENKYIKSLNLNGELLSRSHIDHLEIIKGGTLIFEMGDSPT